MATVTITISPEGKSQIAVAGVAGPGCQKLTEALERAIGTTTEDVKTSDMHRPQSQLSGQATGQGQEAPA